MIPLRRNPPAKRGRPACFEYESYRCRNAVERRVSRLKGERRAGTRQDELAIRARADVTVAEETAEETPVVKRVRPKPAAAVPTEKFSVLMTHDEVAAQDRLKAHLKRQGVILRKMPDA